jgi:4'-phosphopantetheinyl transferase
LHKLALPIDLHGIEAWRLDLDLDAPLADADWIILSDLEKAQNLKLHRHEDRIRHAVTRATLRLLLGRAVGRAPQELLIVPDAFGKPQLQSEGSVEFNVSHSGRFALIALSKTNAVGVDIEQRSKDLDVAGLSKFALSSKERESLSDADAFVERWVLKESILKALGLGIAEHLQATSIERAVGGNAFYEARHPTFDMRAVKACLLEAPEGFRAALAWVDRRKNPPTLRP